MRQAQRRHLSRRRGWRPWAGLVFLGLLLTGCADAQPDSAMDYRHEYIKLSVSDSIKTLLTDFLLLPEEVLRGEGKSLELLKSDHAALAKLLARIRARAAADSHEITDHSSYVAAIDSMDSLLLRARADIDVLEHNQPAIQTAWREAEEFQGRLLPLAAAQDDLVLAMADADASASQIYLASRSIVLLNRMAQRVVEVCGGNETGLTAADATTRDLVFIRQVMAGFSNGNRELGITRLGTPAERNALKKSAELLEASGIHVQRILDAAAAVHQARRASDDLGEVYFQMADEESKLRAAF